MTSVDSIQPDVEEATAGLWRLFRKDGMHLLHREEYVDTMLRVVKLGVADGTFAERAARRALRQDFDCDTGSSPTMTYTQFRRAAAELGRLWSQRESAEQVAGALRFIAHAVAMEEVQLEVEVEVQVELPASITGGATHSELPSALLDAVFHDAVGRGAVAGCGAAWCDIVTSQGSDSGRATLRSSAQGSEGAVTEMGTSGSAVQRVHVARTLRRFRRPFKTFAALGAEHRRDRWLRLQYDPEDGANRIGMDVLPGAQCDRAWCPLPPGWSGTYRARHVRVCRSRHMLRPLGARAGDSDTFGPAWLRLPPPPRFLDDPHVTDLRPQAKEAFLRLDADCSNSLENDELVKTVLWVMRSFQPTAVLAPSKRAEASLTVGADIATKPSSPQTSDRRKKAKKGKKGKKDKAGTQGAQNETEREEFAQLKLLLNAKVDADNDGMVAFDELYAFLVIVLRALSRVARRNELETAAAAKLGKKTKKGKKQTKKRKKKTKSSEETQPADEGKVQGESSKAATGDGTGVQKSVILQALAYLSDGQHSSRTSEGKSIEDGSADKDGQLENGDDSKHTSNERKQWRSEQCVRAAAEYAREHDEEGDHPGLFYSGFEPVLRPAQCYFELRKRRWPSLHWLDGGLAGEQPHLPFDAEKVFLAFDAAQAVSKARLKAQADAKAAAELAREGAENVDDGRGEDNQDEAFVPLEEKPKSYDLALPLPPVRRIRDFDLQCNVADAQHPEIETTPAVPYDVPPLDVPPPPPTFVTAPQYSADVLGVGAGNAASRVRVKPCSFRQLLASCLSRGAHAEAAAEEVMAKELEDTLATAPPASQPALATSGLAAAGWGVMSEMVRPPPKSTLTNQRRRTSVSKATVEPANERNQQIASSNAASARDGPANEVGTAPGTGASDGTCSTETALSVSAEDAAGISGAICAVRVAHQAASKPFADLARDVRRERAEAVRLRMLVRAKRSKMRALAAAAVAAACAARAASKAVRKAIATVATAVAAELARRADVEAQDEFDEDAGHNELYTPEVDSDGGPSLDTDEQGPDEIENGDTVRDEISEGINGASMNGELDVGADDGVDEVTLANEGAWRSTNPSAPASAAAPQSCPSWPPRRRARRGTTVGRVGNDRVAAGAALDGGCDSILFETARTLPLAIAIIGPPLAGKTSLAARLARALGLRLISGGEEVRRALAAVSTIGHSQKKRSSSPVQEFSTVTAARECAVKAAQSMQVPPPTQLQRLVAASVQKSREARTTDALTQAAAEIAPKSNSSTAPPEPGSPEPGSREPGSPTVRCDGDKAHASPQQVSDEPSAPPSTCFTAGIAPDLIERLIAAALEVVHATGQGYVLDCDGEGCAEALALGMGLSLLPAIMSDHGMDGKDVAQSKSTDVSTSGQSGVGVGVGGRIRVPQRADIIIEFRYDDVAARATSNKGHGAFIQVAERLHALRKAHAETDRGDAKKVLVGQQMALQSLTVCDADKEADDMKQANEVEREADDVKQTDEAEGDKHVLATPVDVESPAQKDHSNSGVGVEQPDSLAANDSNMGRAAVLADSILERTLPTLFPIAKQRIDVQHSASYSARMLLQEHDRRDLAASALELMLAVLHERYAAAPCSAALEHLCRVAWRVSSDILVGTEHGDNDIEVHVDERDILLRARPDVGSDGESGVLSGSANVCGAEASARLDGAMLGTNGGVLAAEALTHTTQTRSSSPSPSPEKSGQKAKSALRKSFGAALKFQGVTMSQGRSPSPTSRNASSNEQAVAQGQRSDAGANLVSAPTEPVAFGGSYCSRAFALVDGGGDGGSGDGRGSNQQRRRLCAKNVPPSGRAWIAASLQLKVSRPMLRTFREACAARRRMVVCASHATQDEVFASVLHRLGCGGIDGLDLSAHARARNEPLVICRSAITTRAPAPSPLLLPSALTPSENDLRDESDREAAQVDNDSGAHGGKRAAAMQRAQWLWLLHGDAAESTPSSNMHAVAWPTLLYPPPASDNLTPRDTKLLEHETLEGNDATTDAPSEQTKGHTSLPCGARPFARRWSPWRRCCPVAFFHARQRAQALLHPDALASAWLAAHSNAWAKGSNEITLPPQGDKTLDTNWKKERESQRAAASSDDVEGESIQAKPLGPKAAEAALQKLAIRATAFAAPPVRGLAQHCAAWCGRLFSLSSASALDAFVANAGPFVAAGMPRLQGPLRLTLLPSPSLLRYGQKKSRGAGAAILRAAATNLAALYGLKLVEVSTGLASSVRRASVIGKEPGKKATAGERVAARKRDERVVSTVAKAVNDRTQRACSRVAEAISRRLALDDGEAELAELMIISRGALRDLFEAKCCNEANQPDMNEGPVPMSATPSATASASIPVPRRAESSANNTTRTTRARVITQPKDKIGNEDMQPRLPFNGIVALLRNDCDALWTDSCAPARRGAEAEGAPTHGTMHSIRSHRGYSTLRMVLVARREGLRAAAAKKLKAKGKPPKGKSVKGKAAKEKVPKAKATATTGTEGTHNATALAPIASNGDLMVSWTEFVNGVNAVALMRADAEALSRTQHRMCAQKSAQATAFAAPWQIAAPALRRHRIDRVVFEGITRVAGVSLGGKRVVVEVDRSSGMVHALWPWGFGVEPSGIGGAGVSARWAAGRRHGRISFGTTDDEPLATPEDGGPALFATARPTFSPALSPDTQCISATAINRLGATAAVEAASSMPEAAPPTTCPELLDEYGRRSLPLCLRPGWSWEGEWTASNELVGLGRQAATGAVATFSFRLVEDAGESDGSDGSDLSDDDVVPTPPGRAKHHSPYVNASAIDINPDAADISGPGLLVLGAPHTLAQFKSLVSQKVTLGTVIVIDAPESVPGDSDSDGDDETNTTTQAAMAEAAAVEDGAFEEMVLSMQETAHKSHAKYQSALRDSVSGHDASVAAQCKALTALADPSIMALHRVQAKNVGVDDAHNQYLLRSMRQVIDPFFEQTDDEADMPPSTLIEAWVSARQNRWKVARVQRAKVMAAQRKRSMRQLTLLQQRLRKLRPDHAALEADRESEDEHAPLIDDDDLHAPGGLAQIASADELLTFCHETDGAPPDSSAAVVAAAAESDELAAAEACAYAHEIRKHLDGQAALDEKQRVLQQAIQTAEVEGRTVNNATDELGEQSDDEANDSPGETSDIEDPQSPEGHNAEGIGEGGNDWDSAGWDFGSSGAGCSVGAAEAQVVDGCHLRPSQQPASVKQTVMIRGRRYGCRNTAALRCFKRDPAAYTAAPSTPDATGAVNITNGAAAVLLLAPRGSAALEIASNAVAASATVAIPLRLATPAIIGNGANCRYSPEVACEQPISVMPCDGNREQHDIARLLWTTAACNDQATIPSLARAVAWETSRARRAMCIARARATAGEARRQERQLASTFGISQPPGGSNIHVEGKLARGEDLEGVSLRVASRFARVDELIFTMEGSDGLHEDAAYQRYFDEIDAAMADIDASGSAFESSPSSGTDGNVGGPCSFKLAAAAMVAESDVEASGAEQWTRPDAVIVLLPSRASALARRCKTFNAHLLRAALTAAAAAACAAASASKAAAKIACQTVARAASKQAASQAAAAAIMGQFSAATAAAMADCALAQAVADAGQKSQKKVLTSRAKAAEATMEAVKASETEMRKRLGAQQQRQEQRAALVQDEHQEPVASAGDEGALVLRLAELHERALENFQAEYDRDIEDIIAALEKFSAEGVPIGVPVGADIAATLAISDALSEDLDTVSDGSISLQLAIGAVRAVSNVESGSAARSTSMAHDAPASRRLRAVVKDMRTSRHRRVVGNTLIQKGAVMPLTLAAARKALASGEAAVSEWGGVCPVATRSARHRFLLATRDRGDNGQARWVASGLGEGGLVPSSQQYPVLFAHRVFWLSSLEAVSCFIADPASYALLQPPPPRAAIGTFKCSTPRLVMAAVHAAAEIVAQDVASDTSIVFLTPALCLKWLEQRVSQDCESTADLVSAPKTPGISLDQAFGALDDGEDPQSHLAMTHATIASIAGHDRSLASAVVGAIEKSWAQAAGVALRVRCHDCVERGFVLASMPAFDLDSELQDSSVARKAGAPHSVLLARSILQRARVSCASWLAQQLRPHLCVSLGQSSAVDATESVVETLLHTLGTCGTCVQLANEEVADTSIARRRIWHELAARVGAHTAAAGYRARGLPVPLVAVVQPFHSLVSGSNPKTEGGSAVVPIPTMTMPVWTARQKVVHVDTRHAPIALAKSAIAFAQSDAGASHKGDRSGASHEEVSLEQRDAETRERRAAELATLHADVPPACAVRWALSAGSAACGSGAADAAWRFHDEGALAFFFGGRVVCVSGKVEANMFLATPHAFAAAPPPPRVARPAVVSLLAAQQGHSRLKPPPPPSPKAPSKVPVAKSRTPSEKKKPLAPGGVALRGLCAQSWAAGVAMGNGMSALRHGKQWFACEFPPPADGDSGLDTTALQQLGDGDPRAAGRKQNAGPRQPKGPAPMGRRRGVVFVFETERAARLFCDNAVSTLRDLCRCPPPRAPAALAPFLSAGTLDEATLFAVTEALESVAGLAARATGEARQSPTSRCMKLPALSVAETALKFMALQLRANNPRVATRENGGAELRARRAALAQFQRDCIAHVEVLESAPRGGAAGAVRALRSGTDSGGEDGEESTEAHGTRGARAEEGVGKPFKGSAVGAFRAHAARFDQLRAMSREQLHERFMQAEHA